MAKKGRFHTKLEIIRCATQMFLSKGYTNTLAKELSDELGISPGNLTYHFPTKEHLLAELTIHLCEYHQIALEQEVEDGRTSLLAYLMELTSMMSICEEDEIAKDLYTSIYQHPVTLQLLRKYDLIKVKTVFAEFCPQWSHEDFKLIEDTISGIEYAALMRDVPEEIPLEKRIPSVLDAVMKICNVPEQLRQTKIEKILQMDYRSIGKRLVEGFITYIDDVNNSALKDATD